MWLWLCLDLLVSPSYVYLLLSCIFFLFPFCFYKFLAFFWTRILFSSLQSPVSLEITRLECNPFIFVVITAVFESIYTNFLCTSYCSEFYFPLSFLLLLITCVLWDWFSSWHFSFYLLEIILSVYTFLVTLTILRCIGNKV